MVVHLNHARIATLLRERAALDLLLADEYEALDRVAEQQEAPTWVSVKEFCEAHKISDTTLRRYLKDGMPHKYLGDRVIRINVAGAEAWLEERGSAYRKRGGRAA
jgi:hypothetical protein